MSTLPGPNNAIAYAQFRLQGGWRGTAIAGGVCLTVLVALLTINVATEVANHRPPAGGLDGWPQGLVVMQVLFLLVIGPLRVTAGVRGDVTSRMIESHRLMPLSPAAAVAGYAGGAPWICLVLSAVAFAVGAACCGGTGTDASRFLLAHVVLLFTAVAAWVVTTYLAMANRLGVLVLVVFALFAAAGGGGGGPSELLPGLGVVMGPLVNHSVIPLRGPTFAADAAAVGLAAQAAVAAVCFRAAVRLYRAPGSIGLSPPLGLLLLAVWAAVSAAGIIFPDVFEMRRFSRRDASGPAQLVASVVAALLLSGLPIAAAAKAAERRHRAAEADARSAVWVTAGGAVVVISLLAVLAWKFMPELTYYRDTRYNAARVPPAEAAALARRAVQLTPALALAAVLGLTFNFRLAYLRLDKAWMVTAIWLFLAWGVPLIADAVTSTSDRSGLGPVSSASPVGALVLLWTQPGPDVTAGLVAQFAIAMVPGTLYLTGVLNRRRRQAAVTVASSA